MMIQNNELVLFNFYIKIKIIHVVFNSKKKID